ncbi:hypothetical protein [Massilia sp. TS11]|uniref:hypothetical protein n=1 Tax=Massilia sp. TS11 TaxID=2908003 RepID=UPI001EDBE331|nr:hypothetical protein [Massilia sp. TS11]MCG2583056.1 hypothetical protein [Massilia sp. TS11]
MQPEYIDIAPKTWVHNAEQAWMAVKRHFKGIGDGMAGELRAHAEPIAWNREETEATAKLLGKTLVFRLKLVLSRTSRAYVGECEVFELRKVREVDEVQALGAFQITVDGQTNLSDAEHQTLYSFPEVGAHIIPHYLRKTIEPVL